MTFEEDKETGGEGVREEEKREERRNVEKVEVDKLLFVIVILLSQKSL